MGKARIVRKQEKRVRKIAEELMGYEKKDPDELWTLCFPIEDFKMMLKKRLEEKLWRKIQFDEFGNGSFSNDISDAIFIETLIVILEGRSVFTCCDVTY